MRCVLLCHTESTPWQCSVAISSLIIAKMSIFLMFILHICEKYFMWKNVSKRDFCIINLLRSSPLEWHIFVKLSIWAYAWEFGLNSFFVGFNKKRISLTRNAASIYIFTSERLFHKNKVNVNVAAVIMCHDKRDKHNWVMLLLFARRKQYKPKYSIHT